MKPKTTHILNILLISLVINISTSSNLKSQQLYIAQQAPQAQTIIATNQGCPCEANFKCPPCGIIAIPQLSTFPECPCAKCPPCPSASLIHDLSAKRAQQDQAMAQNLKSTANKIEQYFDMIIKYSGDVVNYEQEAKAKALLMEEASVKAMIARKNMIAMSEKARFIAKTGIVERRPCLGPECVTIESFNDKVFPEEINSVKDYIKGDYATNISPEESFLNGNNNKFNGNSNNFNNNNNFNSNNNNNFNGNNNNNNNFNNNNNKNGEMLNNGSDNSNNNSNNVNFSSSNNNNGNMKN